jgi:hypothetical protein
MSWIAMNSRAPRKGQWVVVPFGEGFKAGEFEAHHPFGPAIIDRMTGKFYHGFAHWKPLTHPKDARQ